MNAVVVEPTNDAVFKILFGSRSSTAALQHLIEAVLGREIFEVEILNPVTDLNTPLEKQTILDVKARARDGDGYRRLISNCR